VRAGDFRTNSGYDLSGKLMRRQDVRPDGRADCVCW
jgi:hypothetical protein